MPYVITDPCLATGDTACVDVCPCDCIHGPRTLDEIRAISVDGRPAQLAGVQLFIDPEVCIDCGACAPECPVDAIYEDSLVPDRYRDAIGRNAAFFRR